MFDTHKTARNKENYLKKRENNKQSKKDRNQIFVISLDVLFCFFFSFFLWYSIAKRARRKTHAYRLWLLRERNNNCSKQCWQIMSRRRRAKKRRRKKKNETKCQIIILIINSSTNTNNRRKKIKTKKHECLD